MKFHRNSSNTLRKVIGLSKVLENYSTEPVPIDLLFHGTQYTIKVSVLLIRVIGESCFDLTYCEIQSFRKHIFYFLYDSEVFTPSMRS